jgi:hypothetical protein
VRYVHDPKRQVGYLQQCLSSDKRPLGFFLGAGCPMAVRTGAEGTDPLIPDIDGLTALVRGELAKCADCGPLLKILDENFKNDERERTTVEDMLTHIRALRSVAGKGEVRGFSAKTLDTLDDKICTLIHEFADKALPNEGTPYHRIATWVDAVRRDVPVEVFTTNYDLLMEQAFEDCQVPYFDGFAGVRRPFFDLRATEEDLLPPRWARLWKLHGSINWYQVANKGVFRGTSDESGDSKRVIHPSHLKYQESRRMPYLAMLDRLKAFLKQPTAMLILCGYSFRDEHLNEVIVQGLQATQTAIAFALQFDALDESPHLLDLASKRSNLNVLAPDGAMIGSLKSSWPERDVESASSDNGRWVQWEPVDPEDEKSNRRAILTIGDFSQFGQFVQEIVGRVPPTTGSDDAQ